MIPRLHPLFDPDVLAGAAALKVAEENAQWQQRVEMEFAEIEQAMARQERLLRQLIEIIAGPTV